MEMINGKTHRIYCGHNVGDRNGKTGNLRWCMLWWQGKTLYSTTQHSVSSASRFLWRGRKEKCPLFQKPLTVGLLQFLWKSLGLEYSQLLFKAKSQKLFQLDSIKTQPEQLALLDAELKDVEVKIALIGGRVMLQNNPMRCREKHPFTLTVERVWECSP